MVDYVRPSTTKAYGNYVVVKHEYNDLAFRTWYCHLDKIYVAAGDAAPAGTALGELGTTGNSTGEHVHLNLQVMFMEINTDWTIPNVIDPNSFFPMHSNVPFRPIYPSVKQIDLLRYMLGDGRRYVLRHMSGPNAGATETVQTQQEGNIFFFVKNQQWEELKFDGDYIYRRRDTSPGPAPKGDPREGEMRWYTQFVPGSTWAPWAKRFMVEGEEWVSPYVHTVQFRYKDGCAKSPMNSGLAQNRLLLRKHHPVWSAGGLSIDDVIEVATSTNETMFFGAGFGLVGWEAKVPAASSTIVEIVSDGKNVRESGCFSIAQ